LELAASIGKAQEDKALLKAEKHHQPQVSTSHSQPIISSMQLETAYHDSRIILGRSAPRRAYAAEKRDKKEIGKSSNTVRGMQLFFNRFLGRGKSHHCDTAGTAEKGENKIAQGAPGLRSPSKFTPVE